MRAVLLECAPRIEIIGFGRIFSGMNSQGASARDIHIRRLKSVLFVYTSGQDSCLALTRRTGPVIREYCHSVFWAFSLMRSGIAIG